MTRRSLLAIVAAGLGPKQSKARHEIVIVNAAKLIANDRFDYVVFDEIVEIKMKRERQRDIDFLSGDRW